MSLDTINVSHLSTTCENTRTPSSLPACSTMLVESMHGLECVHVPGFNLQGYGPHFAQGYAWGCDEYWSEVEGLVNADGTPYQGDGVSSTQLETGAVRFEKVKDLCPSTVARLIRELVTDPKGLYRDVSFMERVGTIVGYIATCVEDSYGLCCKACGRSHLTCAHAIAPTQEEHHV